MPEYIDLHTHSTASDGTDSPASLVEKAAGIGLAAMALTDHDTLGGLAEAQEAVRDLDMKFIRGCELSTTTDRGEMHILGLWLPEDCQPLELFLQHLRRKRQDRNQQIVEKLRSLGFAISMEEVAAHARSSIGRPHIAAVLVEKGYVENIEQAFTSFLGINGVAYVPKISPRPAQAVRLLNDLGATAVLAHPLLRPRPPKWLENLAWELAQEGLAALEAWHSAQDEAQSAEIIDLAKKLGLGLSGGSDYHGANKAAISLGTGRGNLRVPVEVLHNLIAARKARGLPC